ncbi:MAG TPA: hypothetical protein VFC14_07950 [Burkholderiales bacterium]|nr:hypothetical protein [Burkholderiales bacterium]
MAMPNRSHHTASLLRPKRACGLENGTPLSVRMTAHTAESRRDALQRDSRADDGKRRAVRKGERTDYRAFRRAQDLQAARESGPTQMIRSQLHAIAVRRRGDPDVAALLWEIKRLRDLLATIGAHLSELRHEEPTHREYFHSRLQDLLEAERVRFDPKTFKPGPLYDGKPERTGPEGTEGERAAKRRAREERG